MVVRRCCAAAAEPDPRRPSVVGGTTLQPVSAAGSFRNMFKGLFTRRGSETAINNDAAAATGPSPSADSSAVSSESLDIPSGLPSLLSRCCHVEWLPCMGQCGTTSAVVPLLTLCPVVVAHSVTVRPSTTDRTLPATQRVVARVTVATPRRDPS